jgi:hypothetical protein
MDLFRKALESSDEEIKFLYFYKIIEFYSPIAAKISAYEGLSKKLDTLKYKTASNKDLASIFSIADKFRVSQTDKELAQTVLVQAIDMVEHFAKLPNSIQRSISKSLHFSVEELNYKTKPETIQGIHTFVSNVLYSTRNSIVHAKSNYKSDSNECKPEDLQTLNSFLKETCYLIINWHCKLPHHLKYNE